MAGASLLVAHLSDCHVVPEPALCYGRVDTRRCLADAIEALRRLQPDLVVMTGDLVDEPSAEAYATLRHLLEKLEIPAIVIPGNHDDRAELSHAMPAHDYLPPDGAPAHFVVDRWPVRIVAFDAVVKNKEYSACTDEGLAWLDATLRAENTRPVMILMHHPPLLTGLPFMDAFQPPFDPRFAQIIARHPQVQLIACGHVHRIIDGVLGTARMAVAGSTAHQFLFTTSPTAPPRLSFEPPMIRLHRWSDGQLTSFVTPVDQSFATAAFAGVDETTWPAIAAKLLAGAPRPAGHADDSTT